MIERVSFYQAASHNPYDNIAMEEYLLHQVTDTEVILYLWQNGRTVVIGRNQNARAECRVETLTAEGGHLARRLSGGGAVYHDLGNLNFTFLTQGSNYSLDRQLQVILTAVQSLGIAAVKSGRNDLTADGRKFSGNAFYQSGTRHYHHGTLLVHSDMEQLGRYLNPDREKLLTHGVESVRARVGNLSEWNPGVTVESMGKALLLGMAAVYGMVAEPFETERLSEEAVQKLRGKYASEEWLLGAERPFTTGVEQRFSWGRGELCLRIQGNRVAEAAFYTDALDGELSGQVVQALTGVRFEKKALLAAIQTLSADFQEDIKRLLEKLSAFSE